MLQRDSREVLIYLDRFPLMEDLWSAPRLLNDLVFQFVVDNTTNGIPWVCFLSFGSQSTMDPFHSCRCLGRNV